MVPPSCSWAGARCCQEYRGKSLINAFHTVAALLQVKAREGESEEWGSNLARSVVFLLARETPFFNHFFY